MLLSADVDFWLLYILKKIILKFTLNKNHKHFSVNENKTMYLL